VRAKALVVLTIVDETGEPPAGYVGGRQFMNDGRGGTAPLPRYDASRRQIVYHEYDVNPHRSGVDRGPQRLVVGNDGSAWCTADHYVSWTRLR
jgi:guanyl-specific ribonuclease Sa